MSVTLIPLHTLELLGIFRETLETSLIERGAAQGIDLRGPADEFWRSFPPHELSHMAEAGNGQAQAERASRRKDLRGMTWLGLRLLRGHGISKDTERALQLLQDAAGKGAA